MKNKVLIHATMQMNYENIVLRERIKLQKTTNCMNPFKCNIQNMQY